MRVKKGRRRIRLKAVIVFAMIIAFCVGTFMFIRGNLNPIILSLTEAKVKQLASSAINDAAYSVLPTEAKYSDFIEVIYDNNGNVTMLQANTMKINNIASVSATRAQENLDAIANQEIRVPIGAVTGLAAFMGMGEELHIKMMPVGTVSAEFLSQFNEAGINQTIHKIYMEVRADIVVVLPTIKQTITSISEILICETILVGAVPDTFLNFNRDNILNLVP